MATNPIKWTSLLDEWKNAKAVDENTLAEIQAQMIDAPTKKKFDPWYIRAALTISAWAASILLILGTLIIFGQWDDGMMEILLIFGVIYLVLSLILHFRVRKLQSGDFLSQLALAVNIAGVVMFAAGFYEAFDSSFIFYGGLLWLLLGLLVVYQNPIHNFLNTLGILGVIGTWIADLDMQDIFPIFVVLIGLAFVVLTENETKLIASPRYTHLVTPVGFALGFALLVLTSILAGDLLRDEFALTWWILPAGMAILLLIVEWMLIRLNGKDLPQWVVVSIFASTLLVAVLTHLFPGILAGFLIIFISFDRRRTPLFWFAILFTVFYIGNYFVYIDFPLWVKAYMMLGTGLVLLVERWLVNRFLGRAPASN